MTVPLWFNFIITISIHSVAMVKYFKHFFLDCDRCEHHFCQYKAFSSRHALQLQFSLPLILLRISLPKRAKLRDLRIPFEILGWASTTALLHFSTCLTSPLSIPSCSIYTSSPQSYSPFKQRLKTTPTNVSNRYNLAEMLTQNSNGRDTAKKHLKQ